MPAIEDYNSDEFDDDTDLPLPSAPVSRVPAASPVDAGASQASANPMAGLQAMMEAMGAGGLTDDPRMGMSGGKDKNVTYVEDDSPYKDWHPIYPIYLDAKRAFGSKGGRRIPREKAHWWPLAKDIVPALKALRLPIFVEAHKTHPKDWDNPGRVKTEFLRDGEPINAKITNRKQLYLAVSEEMHRLGTSVPAPQPTGPVTKDRTERLPVATSITSAVKGVAARGSGTTTAGRRKRVTRRPHPHPTRVAPPPMPLPAVEKRLPEMSPALAGGHFLDILKNEWTREQEAKAAAPVASAQDEASRIEDGPASGGKEKKEKKPKVKMIRGGKR